MRTILVTPLLLLLTLTVGCVKYNYDIVRPGTAVLRVGEDWRQIEGGWVNYRFRVMDNHLVVLVYNTTGDPIRINGTLSYIVTPGKETIPVSGQVIGPGAYVKLILPPVEQITRPGPTIIFGVGGSTGRAEAEPAYIKRDGTGPVYLDMGAPEGYWEWEEEGEATLHLAFEQGERTFDQTFVIHRAKV